MNKQNKKGFTLTEILVVVLVISILAAIAYPMYMRSITKSKAVEAINLLEMVRNKQLQNFARKGKYLTDFSTIQGLTSDASQENNTGTTIKINDYTLSLNTDKNCMMATYNKGNTHFTFSSSYETAGLGCTGDICKSFGDIVGSADSVCGCNTTCSNGFTLDSESCSCKCDLGCNNGSSCTTPSQNQPLTQSCGSGGSQTRVCTASCGGGTCGAWGPCAGQSCDDSLKPEISKACGTCGNGTTTRSVMCNTSTGAWVPGPWGACVGDVCSCPQNEKPALSKACGTCGNGTSTRNVTCNNATGEWVASDWSLCTGDTCTCPESSKPVDTQSCGNCNKGTQSRAVHCDTSIGKWIADDWEPCLEGAECSPGATQSCGPHAEQLCSSSCSWGACKGSCAQESKPESTRTCSTCGTQTRTVTCDTSNYIWKSGAWSSCDTSACPNKYDCCCGKGGIEIPNNSGASCSSYNYTPKLMGCFCSKATCDLAEAALCTDCGGTWNDTKCTCDCGTYKGNACRFGPGGCLCGTLYRACR